MYTQVNVEPQLALSILGFLDKFRMHFRFSTPTFLHPMSRNHCRYLPVQRVGWQDVKGSQVLMGNYEEAVKMMGDTNFLSSLIRFPKEAITDETVELLEPYFKAQDFNFESAKKVLAPPYTPCVMLLLFGIIYGPKSSAVSASVPCMTHKQDAVEVLSTCIT